MQTCPLQSCRGVRAAVTNSGVQARAPSRRGPRGGSHVARPVADGEAGGAGGRSELQARAARPRRVSRDVRHLTRTARWHLGVHSAVHPPPLPSSEILPSPPERAACPPPSARSPRPPRPPPPRCLSGCPSSGHVTSRGSGPAPSPRTVFLGPVHGAVSALALRTARRRPEVRAGLRQVLVPLLRAVRRSRVRPLSLSGLGLEDLFSVLWGVCPAVEPAGHVIRHSGSSFSQARRPLCAAPVLRLRCPQPRGRRFAAPLSALQPP